MIVYIGDWRHKNWGVRWEEMKEWCDEQCPGALLSENKCYWIFPREEDAMMFVLRWQGAE